MARLRLLNVLKCTPRSLNPRRLDIILDLESENAIDSEGSVQRIGLIAAIQYEINPLLRMMTQIHQEAVGKQRMYRFRAGERSLCLVQSGIGPVNAASATRLLIDRYRPELIISFGFAGSLSPELFAGDIVVADRLLHLHNGLFTEQQGLAGELCGAILPQSERATFITTEKVTAKKELAAGLPDDITRAVVEMETAAVAQIADQEKISLVAVRAISDNFDDELGFTLDEFCDNEMNLQKRRVMLTAMRKPWILPQLIRLAGNSRSASRKLAESVTTIISAFFPSSRSKTECR